jgi:hypothetical protein
MRKGTVKKAAVANPRESMQNVNKTESNVSPRVAAEQEAKAKEQEVLREKIK